MGKGFQPVSLKAGSRAQLSTSRMASAFALVLLAVVWLRAHEKWRAVAQRWRRTAARTQVVAATAAQAAAVAELWQLAESNSGSGVGCLTPSRDERQRRE